MAVQTTYSENIRAAVEGMIADMQAEINLVSRTVETAAGIGFGKVVDQGTADRGTVVAGASTDKPIGFTVRERSVDPASPNAFAQYDSARIMTKGVIWVTVDDAGGVAAGDDVWLTLSTNTLSNADAGSGDGLKLAGCRWATSAADGELAIVEVDMSVPAVAGAA